MPLIIMVLVSSLAIFQMFFRYEHWNSEKYDGVVYERDALTGEIHVLQPGQEVGVPGGNGIENVIVEFLSVKVALSIFGQSYDS